MIDVPVCRRAVFQGGTIRRGLNARDIRRTLRGSDGILICLDSREYRGAAEVGVDGSSVVDQHRPVVVRPWILLVPFHRVAATAFEEKEARRIQAGLGDVDVAVNIAGAFAIVSLRDQQLDRGPFVGIAKRQTETVVAVGADLVDPRLQAQHRLDVQGVVVNIPWLSGRVIAVFNARVQRRNARHIALRSGLCIGIDEVAVVSD